MCFSGPKPQPAPKVVTPEPPPPPEPTPEAPVNEGSKRSDASSRDSRRKGVSALRISLSVPQSGGQGVNVPS